MDVSLLAVAIGALGAFVLGGAYYAALGDRLSVGGDAAMPPAKVAAELARCLTLALVVCTLAAWGSATGIDEGLLLGLLLFAGFPLVLWTGAVLHGASPRRDAVIHGGDWLAKLLLIGGVAGLLS